jgi:alpha-1,2-mannosyltransferase
MGLSVLCVMAFLWDVVLVRVMVALNMNDFGRFYYSARAYLAGQDMYAPSPATPLGAGQIAGAQQLLNLNPPHFHVFVLPLALLAPSVAVTLWMVASTWALVFSLLIVCGENNFVPTAKRVLLIALFVLIFSGSQAVFITGQMTFLLLLPMTLCWRDARRGRWGRAGAWLGACASVKPFLLIFVPYLIGRRRWRASVIMAATLAGCFGIGLIIFGVGSYVSWVRAMEQSSDWAWLGMNASTLGTFQRVFMNGSRFQPVVLAPRVAAAWTFVAGAIGLATIFVVVADKSAAETDRAFALLLVAAQLLSPVGWVYYLWLAAGPVAAIAFSSRRSQWVPRPVAVFLGAGLAGFFTPISAPYFFQPSAWATLILGSVYFWASLALWAWLVLRVPVD